MRKDKEIAHNLRTQGKSYRQIRDELKVPLSTLSDWFKDIEWSKEMAVRLAAQAQIRSTARIVELDRIRGQHLTRAYEEARAEARDDLEALKYNPLFIAGLMLYWGEGDKLTKQTVKITNTDPGLIRLYVFFLTNACGIPVEKIKAQVLIYPDLNEADSVQYWAEQSGLSAAHFSKCSTINGRHKTRKLGHGVCMIVVSSTYLKVKILEWLRLLPKELMNGAYYAKIPK
jgi:hypothetical protein